MRVAFITGGFPDSENSLKGVFNKKAAIELAKKVNLTVIHYRMIKPGRKLIERMEENGYRLIRIAIPQIPFFNKYTICVNTYLMQLIIKPFVRKYDVIHSVSGITGLSIGRLKNKLNYKHVCQIIGSDINFILPELKSIGCINVIKGIDSIVCNSNSLKNQVSKIFGKKTTISVIYRGVKLNNNTKKDLKSDIVFLFLGGLVDYKHSKYRKNLKGGQTLMKAWRIVEKKISKKTSIKLLFGGPKTSDNIELENWKERLDFKDKVEILGRIDPKNILEVYASSNVTIIPSLTEGFPNVGMESFASENCVIGSDVGGLPELIDDEINGLIFKKGSEKQLAEKILKLIDVELVNRLRKNAINKAIENYDNTKFADKYVEIYSR